jgi:hypothetical protein
MGLQSFFCMVLDGFYAVKLQHYASKWGQHITLRFSCNSTLCPRARVNPHKCNIFSLTVPFRCFLHKTRCRIVRLFPYMDDFLFRSDSYEDTLRWRDRHESLLQTLRLKRNTQKGIWTPTQLGDHLAWTDNRPC